MARILITGGAGFIGSHLCERFLADEHEVVCMDNLITGNADNIAHMLVLLRKKRARHHAIPPLNCNYLPFSGGGGAQFLF